MRHHSLGLEERDRVNPAFGGGIPSGAICLLEGENGTGKSVLTQRMAYGLAEEGTDVSIVSPELTASGFIDQMHSLSYDIEDHLLENNVMYFHVDVNTYVEVGARQQGTQTLISRLFEPSPIWNGTVTIIDGFDSLLRNDPRYNAAVRHSDEDHAMTQITSALRRLTTGDRSIVLTVNQDPLSDRGLQPLRDVADLYLSLETSTIGQTIQNKALVRKFAGMKNPVDDTIGFTCQQGRGIVIESRTVA